MRIRVPRSIPMLLITALLLAAGCGREYDNSGASRSELEAAASSAFEAGSWRDAEILYTQLLFNFPGATDTDLYLFRLGVADAGQKLWADADFNLRRVVDEFPGSSLADDAQLQIARTLWMQKRDFRRDLTPVEGALSETRAFFAEYPGSSLLPEAQALEDSCLAHLARRSLFTGQFYERRGLLEAALLYYRDALDDYEGRGCLGEILVSMGGLYEKMGNAFAARSSYNRAVTECELDDDLRSRAEEGLARVGGV